MKGGEQGWKTLVTDTQAMTKKKRGKNLKRKKIQQGSAKVQPEVASSPYLDDTSKATLANKFGTFKADSSLFAFPRSSG